jgi:GxxExxY protein
MLVGTEEENKLTGSIVGAAIRVHKVLGPGLLEHSYLTCLRHELIKAGHDVQSELLVALKYDNLIVDRAYRLDLLVDQLVVVEVKAINKVKPVHHSQVLTYMKLTGKRLGLLINFNVSALPEGVKRFRR